MFESSRVHRVLRFCNLTKTGNKGEGSVDVLSETDGTGRASGEETGEERDIGESKSKRNKDSTVSLDTARSVREKEDERKCLSLRVCRQLFIVGAIPSNAVVSPSVGVKSESFTGDF